MNNEEAQELTRIEQSMEQYAMQRKQFQNQLIEVETALKNINKENDTYRIIGNLMIKQDYEKIKKELEEKKEVLAVRIKTIEQQEEKLAEKLKETQKKALNKIEKSDEK